jgi:hypothetical protein
MRATVLRLGRSMWLLAAFLATAHAAAPVNLPSNSTDPKALCTHQRMALENPAPLFPAIRESALEVRRALCVKSGTREEILTEFSDFVRQLIEKDWFGSFGGFKDTSGSDSEPMAQVRDALNSAAPIPTAGVPIGTTGIEIAGKIYVPKAPELCDSKAGGLGCGGALDEFLEYYNYAHNTFASEGARAVARTFSNLSKEWAAYLDSSRSFTPLELAINSALYKRNEGRQFAPPPNVQWIVLHPSLVIENVEDAVRGEQTKEALMIELAGANWWKQDKWYIPTGGSLIGVYTDRSGIDEIGYGIALHFRSVYSLGYARHDDDDGIFISMDLLKFLQDKRKVLQEF